MVEETLFPEDDVAHISIEEEMRQSYLDYAMSVIVSRALPDIRDGLKPVHRRILYAMKESGYVSDKPHRKSARIVGDVMGKYHPHGDSAIYDAMVRMAQDFSMRIPLVDGQGNFGSMDGDRAAAMRYTEARLSKVAETLLDDIANDTVDFLPNYDGSEHEPAVLPARLPNLLINGASGIAVGMATNIPPHNPGETIRACLALLENSALTSRELMAHIKGPDFPTGGEILRANELENIYETGRGSILIRSKCHFETTQQGKVHIIVTETPYQVNKSRLIERIADLFREGKITGVSDLRDESNRKGVRIVISLKKDANPDLILSQLYQFSPLQTSFGINLLALDGQIPKLVSLKTALQAFLDFRENVLIRRTSFLLSKSRERAHILTGLLVAVADIDIVISLIRQARDPAEARKALLEQPWRGDVVKPFLALVKEDESRISPEGLYEMSELQARAILDLRLHRLTGLEQEKIMQEAEKVGLDIVRFLSILQSRDDRFGVIRDELKEIEQQVDTPRKSLISFENPDTNAEDLIAREDVVVSVTGSGYIKRVPLSTYRAQRRGGRGRSGMNVRQEDFIREIFTTSTHTTLLFFTSSGLVYQLKVYELPAGLPGHRGKSIINLLPLTENETVSTVMPLPEKDSEDVTIIFATRKGNVRRNRLSDFTQINKAGKIAMKLDKDDRLVGVKICQKDQDVLLASRDGQCIRFSIDATRIFQGRASTGVRGIKLSGKDSLVSISLINSNRIDIETRTEYLRGAALERRALQNEEITAEEQQARQIWLANEQFQAWQQEEQFLLTFTENGFGKRSSTYEYRVTARGGQGITNIKTTPKTGAVVESFHVNETDHVIMASNQGQLTRFPVKGIRIAGRASQGVILFRMTNEEYVVSAARLADSGEEDETANDPEANG